MDQFVGINSLPGFRLALMLTMRILASNVFEPQQRRYRNMALPDPLAEDVKFKYRLGLLWRLSPPSSNPRVHQAVSDMSFCPSNGDIMAVAYGVYSHGKVGRLPRSGWVYVWNIKNPVNPERCYHYQVPVVTVEFSPTQPQLLAIGLHNGSVEVRDISGQDLPPLAISQRSTSPHFEPVTAIKWIYFEGDVGSKDPHITPFLATSQAGAVTKYRLINSPSLLGFEQQRLQRAEGELEGIPIERAPPAASLLANRHPQCLELVLDPVQADIYYVLTDEGTLYKCSTNYPLQHLELRQAHDGPAACMEFSPWSPRMYLTCGSDWWGLPPLYTYLFTPLSWLFLQVHSNLAGRHPAAHCDPAAPPVAGALRPLEPHPLHHPGLSESQHRGHLGSKEQHHEAGVLHHDRCRHLLHHLQVGFFLLFCNFF